MNWVVAAIAGIASGLAFGLLGLAVGLAGRSASREATFLPVVGAMVGIVAGTAVGRWSGLGTFGGALLILPVVVSAAVALPRFLRAWAPADPLFRPVVAVAGTVAATLVLAHLGGERRGAVGSRAEGLRAYDTVLASWTVLAAAALVILAWAALGSLYFLPRLRRRWEVLAADCELAELWGIDPHTAQVVTAAATAGAGVLAGIGWAAVGGSSAMDAGVLLLAVATVRAACGPRLFPVAHLLVGLAVGLVQQLGEQARVGLGWILVAALGLTAAALRARVVPLAGEAEIVA